MDVGKGREQEAVSFAYMDVGKGREQEAVSFAALVSNLTITYGPHRAKTHCAWLRH